MIKRARGVITVKMVELDSANKDRNQIIARVLIVLILVADLLRIVIGETNLYVDGGWLPLFIESVLLILAFGVIVSDKTMYRDNLAILPPWLLTLSLCFFITVAVTAYTSDVRSGSVFMASHWVLYFFLAYLAYVTAMSNDNIVVIAAYCLLAAVSLYAFFYLDYVLKVYIDIGSLDSLTVYDFPYRNYVREAGIYWGGGFCLALILLGEKKDSIIVTALLFSLCCLFLSLVIWTSTRAAMVSVIAVFIVMACLDSRYRAMRFGLMAIAIVACALFVNDLIDGLNANQGMGRLAGKVDHLLEGRIDKFSSNRFTIWVEYLVYLKDHWLLGSGEASHYLIRSEKLRHRSHPENMLLYFWVNWGVIGLGVMISLMSWLVIGSLKKMAASSQSLGFLLSFSLVSYVLSAALIEAGFIRTFDKVWFFVFAGFLIAGQVKNRKAVSGKPSNIVKTGLLISGSVASLFLLVGLIEIQLVSNKNVVSNPQWQSTLISQYPAHTYRFAYQEQIMHEQYYLMSEQPGAQRKYLKLMSKICSLRRCRVDAEQLLSNVSGND
jgi:hypothetical protein